MPDHVWDQGLWDQARWDTRTADTGVIALTGGAVALRIVRRAPVTTAAFMLAGQPAALRAARSYPLTAVTGAVTITCFAAGLRLAHKLLVASGGLALTGQPATFAWRHAYRLTADSGSLLAFGRAAVLSKTGSYGLGANTGEVQLTGRSCGLVATRRLPMTAGVLALSGTSVNLVYLSKPHFEYTLSATFGALLLTGTIVLLRPARTPQPPIEVQPGVLNFGRHKKYLLGPWVGPWR